MSSANFTTPLPRNEAILQYGPQSSERKDIQEELKVLRADPIHVPLVIGGKRIENQPADIFEPHDHKRKVGVIHQGEAEHFSAAIDASLKARIEWTHLPWTERAAVFLKAADLLSTKYRDRMNAATMLGQSKTVFQSEIDAVCELADFFRFNAHFAEKIYSEQPYSPAGQWNRSVARGLEGFVFAIGPFNFTSISINLAAAPALMGCSVLWKPAKTALPASYVGLQVLEEAGLPPGVINLVSGDAETISNVALNHPDLAGIHFTGSTNTFNMLWKTVGNQISKYKTYPRLVGETGGKDFVFAHPSADVNALVTALVRGAFEYQGQKCSAASRAYVPKSLWPQVKEKLVDMTNSLAMGDPTDFKNFVAAVIDKRAFARIKGYIDQAKHSKDAKIIAGGETDDSKGFFVKPTVIECQDPKYVTMVEEIFGPVLSVYVYEDKKLEDAIQLCDSSTPYALTGAIFAQDRLVINDLTQKLSYAAGNFYINDKPTGAVVGQQPFGGSRASGTNDKAGSPLNLLRWTSHRTIKENFYPVTNYRYPYMD